MSADLVEVLIDLKNGQTITIRTDTFGIAQAIRASSIDHVEVRVGLPPETPPMKSVFRRWSIGP